MFELVEEGLPEKKNGNGFRKLNRYPTEKIDGVCLECHAKVKFKGQNGHTAAQLKSAFKTKALRQGKRFAGHGWTADCPYCGGVHTVFYLCVKTTLANNHINPNLRMRE